MTHVLFAVGMLVASLIFALLEIQIEGDRGWAEGLPCWRWENKWTKMLLANRPITGYHVYVHAIVIMLLHATFFMSLVPWSLHAELRIVAFLMLFYITEDYLWFVVNPAFGPRRFRAELIWWHKTSWWWIMPRDYWIFYPLGWGLYALSWYIK